LIPPNPELIENFRRILAEAVLRELEQPGINITAVNPQGKRTKREQRQTTEQVAQAERAVRRNNFRIPK
jgi:hypothetical protein